MNVRFGKAKAADAYHSAILELDAPRAAPGVIEAVRAMDLTVTDRGAQRTADIMAMLLGVFSLVGGTILAVAVAAVGHSFFVTVWIRRREIGVLRALGASRSDLRLFFLSEAGLVGAVSGAAGVAAAVLAAKVLDRIAAEYVPDFPYKPESFFHLPSWLLMGSIALAVIACLAGALIPVWRATAKDPAEALTSV
jgi:ABC-type antimicrobial peptide transport system permease subunit